MGKSTSITGYFVRALPGSVRFSKLRDVTATDIMIAQGQLFADTEKALEFFAEGNRRGYRMQMLTGAIVKTTWGEVLE